MQRSTYKEYIIKEMKRAFNGEFITGKLQWTCFGGQLPYLSITGAIYKGDSDKTAKGYDKEPHTCGTIHDVLNKHFSEARALTPWHCCDSEGLPTHYAANSIFHLENGNIEHFKSTSLWFLDGDDELLARFVEEYDTLRASGLPIKYGHPVFQKDTAARKWLVERIPFIKESFDNMLRFFGIEKPAEHAIELEARNKRNATT